MRCEAASVLCADSVALSPTNGARENGDALVAHADPRLPCAHFYSLLRWSGHLSVSEAYV